MSDPDPGDPDAGAPTPGDPTPGHPTFGHPTSGLDDVVHQRARLGILSVLAEADRVDFAFLQDTLDLSPGNLSRHLSTLGSAGLVAVEKGYEGRRPRTWIRITREGRGALRREIAALRALVARVERNLGGP